MANYQIVKPSAELRPFVDEFWVQENVEKVENCPPTTVLPTNTIDLIFTYRDPFIQVNNDKVEHLPLSYVCGQKTKSIQVAPSGKTGLIIVRFYAWGAAPFFDISLDELTDSSVDLHLLAPGQLVRILESEIHELASSVERIHRIEAFLLKQLNAKRHDRLIVEAVHRMNRATGNFSISNLASELNLSRRQFHRRFTSTVGMGPKTFAQIIRFQKTLYQTKCGADWRDLITDCGFYDQAHLIRQMKKYSGFSYRNVLSANPDTLLTKSFNATHKMSHLYNTVYL